MGQQIFMVCEFWGALLWTPTYRPILIKFEMRAYFAHLLCADDATFTVDSALTFAASFWKAPRTLSVCGQPVSGNTKLYFWQAGWRELFTFHLWNIIMFRIWTISLMMNNNFLAEWFATATKKHSLVSRHTPPNTPLLELNLTHENRISSISSILPVPSVFIWFWNKLPVHSL